MGWPMGHTSQCSQEDDGTLHLACLHQNPAHSRDDTDTGYEVSGQKSAYFLGSTGSSVSEPKPWPRGWSPEPALGPGALLCPVQQALWELTRQALEGRAVSWEVLHPSSLLLSFQIIAAQEEMLKKERELEEARKKLAQIRQQQYKFLPTELREDEG